ncbi:hypothetical protein QAD02_023940 [Eretmocerus hayati]|uniref:Uncharacterized protein n=1 Tax=Eretmocerus hayati TaxID=131215 RepID=A0ACC2PXL0_9HYME|nr:hypothetical protein QAD02_023940 [Eretmocerus hayati]
MSKHLTIDYIPQLFRASSEKKHLASVIIECGKHDEVEKLILEGADVNEFFRNNSCLHLAVQRNDLKLVQTLLDAGAKLDVYNKWGLTPLHVAASKNFIDVIKLLKARGANCNAMKSNTVLSEACTPLHVAVKADNYDVVRFLIENGARVDVLNKWGHTPLHIAIIKKLSETSKLLIENGANVNVIDPKGLCHSSTGLEKCYILHTAVKHADIDVIDYLIRYGTDINVIDFNGRSALYYAVQRSDERIVALLLKNGARVRETVDVVHNLSNKFTVNNDPLFLAVRRSDNTRIIEMLLDAGGNVNIPSNHQLETTLLHEAVKWSHQDVVELLLKYDAHVNAVDGVGKSVLHYALFALPKEYSKKLQILLSNRKVIVNDMDVLKAAVSCGNIRVLRLVFRYGVKLHIVIQNTPEEHVPLLHLAVRNRDVNLLKYLLDSHIFPVDARDNLGNTALYIAIDKKYLIHAKFLLEWTADPKLICFKNQTPLDLAIEKGLYNIVELMLFSNYNLSKDFEKIFPRIIDVLGSNFETNIILDDQNYPKSKKIGRSSPLVRQLVKYFSLLAVLNNKLNFSLGSLDRYITFLRNTDHSNRLYEECSAELKFMKESVLYDGLSFFDIFTSEGYLQCLSNIHRIDGINDLPLTDLFPLYGKPLRLRVVQIFNTKKFQIGAPLKAERQYS